MFLRGRRLVPESLRRKASRPRAGRRARGTGLVGVAARRELEDGLRSVRRRVEHATVRGFAMASAEQLLIPLLQRLLISK